MPQNLENLTGRLLDAARKAGADAADAIAVEGTSISVDVRGGKLEQAERSEGIDIGLRVFIGSRQACVSSSDTKDATLAEMAERAVAMAHEAPEDPTAGLADPSQLATDWDMAALELADPAADPEASALEECARRIEEQALSNTGVSQVLSSSAGFGRRQMHVSATNGFSGGWERTDNGLSCVAITGSGTGMERDYAGESRIFRDDLPTAEEIGQLAAERALARAGARKPRTGAFPVLFDERISSSLIGHLLAAINGQSIARGASWLRDALGQHVLPEHLSVYEEPLKPRLSASRPFDAEGLATRDRTIVENGVLKGWVLDLSTGRKLGQDSTANALRGVASPPSPSAGNIRLSAGDATRDDLLAQMGTGLLVTSMIGSSINPTTGDYSRGASGFWVENGEIAFPVNECTIAGNLRQMLKTIVPANDAKPHLSRQVPSLLVEGLTIAGE